MAKLARRIVRITHSVEDLYTMFQWVARPTSTWTPNRSMLRMLRRSRARSERAAAGVRCPQCGVEPGALCWDWFPGPADGVDEARVCATHIARKWRAIDDAKARRRIRYYDTGSRPAQVLTTLTMALILGLT